MPLVLVVLAVTPIYHYSKLFFFPLTIWLAWRYIERPQSGRCAVLGLVTALAFLYRHDYGLYIAFGSVVAFLPARAAEPSSRCQRSVLTDSAAYAVTVVAVLAPWASAVHTNEELIEYTKLRTALYQGPPWFCACVATRNEFSSPVGSCAATTTEAGHGGLPLGRRG